MANNWDSYPSGAAGLFAMHARETAEELTLSVCTACGEVGKGPVKDIAGQLVPESHVHCAKISAGLVCCCFLQAGDNDDCPVHKKGN